MVPLCLPATPVFAAKIECPRGGQRLHGQRTSKVLAAASRKARTFNVLYPHDIPLPYRTDYLYGAAKTEIAAEQGTLLLRDKQSGKGWRTEEKADGLAGEYQGGGEDEKT